MNPLQGRLVGKASEFEDARNIGLGKRMMRWIKRDSYELVNFEELTEQLCIYGQHDAGVHPIPLCQIVGSVGRDHAFDREFRPTSNDTRERWQGIERALNNDKPLPPIDVYQVGELYFVIDGNHRVSVSRWQGRAYIDAHIINLETDTSLRNTTEARAVLLLNDTKS